MKIPNNIQTFETDLSTMWFDENGILCSVYKKNAVISKEALKKSFRIINEKANGDKVCWLGEINHISVPDKETRDFAAAETPKVIKALALLTQKKFSNFIANLFFNLKKAPYPRKLFDNEKEAKKWLRQYL